MQRYTDFLIKCMIAAICYDDAAFFFAAPASARTSHNKGTENKSSATKETNLTPETSDVRR